MATVTARIDLATVATVNKDVDQMLAEDAWFGKTAVAVYQTSKVERTSDGGFQLLGELTLKGRKAPVAVPFKIVANGKRARAEGSLSLDRAAFGIGPTGPISGMVIDNEVKLKLVIVAERST